MNDTIGIDISKDRLDAYWLSNHEHRQFCNDQAGVKALALWAREVGIAQVIIESTGVYHRLVETGLAQHGISFARVNPRQARRFCEGAGQLAKTDRVDAAMLAKMGALLELKADVPRSETQHDLKQLATVRQGLLKDRSARTGAPERQASGGVGRPCAHIEAIGGVARQGAYPGGACQCQAVDLFTSRRGGALQPRHEGKIRATDFSGKVQEIGDHSRHAQAHRHGKRIAARWAEME